MAAEIVLSVAGQISEPREVGPGARITATGSGYIEWTSGTLADVRNGAATWQAWPKGETTGYADTLRRVVIRARATGALTVDIDESRQDAGAEGAYWQESVPAWARDSSGNEIGLIGTNGAIIPAPGVLGTNGRSVQGDLLYRFSSAAALTAVSGAVLENSSITFEGVPTVKLTSPSAGTTSGAQITGLSVPTRNSSFVLLVYIPDYSKVQAVIPYLSQGASLTPNYVSFTGYSLSNDSHKYSGWHAIEVSQDMWTATGTGVAYDGTTAKVVRVDVTPRAGQIAEVFLAAVYLNTWTQPSIMFTWDDGRLSQYTNGLAIHERYGIPMNCYVIPPLLGAAGQFTVSNATEIEARGGAICNHAFYDGLSANDSYAELGLAAYVAQVAACRDWLAARRFSGAEHHAYVEGAYDEILAAELQRIGIKTARHISGNNTTGAQSMTTAWGVHRRMAIKGGLQLSSARSLAAAQTEIDRAIRDGRSLLFTGHDVFTTAEGGAGALSWLASDLDSLLAYVATYRSKGQCVTPTLPQWHKSLRLVT